MHRFWRALVVAATIFVIGSCMRAAPPPPTDRLIPATVGVVRDWTDGRYVLFTGAVVELKIDRAPGLYETARLSTTALRRYDRPRSFYRELLLAAGGQRPSWYAVAAGTGKGPCPFRIQGEAVYDGGDALLFSSGLALRKASDFTLGPSFLVDQDIREPYPLSKADAICLDETGMARSVEMWTDR